jgi:hypothetical protein
MSVDTQVTDPVPDQQLVAAAMYNPKPQPVTAEQFLAAKTAMTLTTLLATTTDYTINPTGVRSAHCQSHADSGKAYVMNDTDWLVLGPNLEAIYTNTQFTALFGAAPGNSMSFSFGPTPSDPMTVQVIVFIGGAAGTVDIDWGDNTTHYTGSVGVGINPTLTHTYTTESFFTLWVAYSVGGVQTVAQGGSFQAKAPIPPQSAISMMGPGGQPITEGGPMPTSAAGNYGFALPPGNNPTGIGMFVTAPDMPYRDAGLYGEGIGSMGTYTDEEMAALNEQNPYFEAPTQPTPPPGAPTP